MSSIIDCLPPSKVDLLKNRMIFVEWNNSDPADNSVSTHSIDFGKGKTLAMTRVLIDRYMPVFSNAG